MVKRPVRGAPRAGRVLRPSLFRPFLETLFWGTLIGGCMLLATIQIGVFK